MVKVEDVALTDDGVILNPIPVDVSEVIDGPGLDLWNDARDYAIWVEDNGERAEGLHKAWPTSPNQVPGPIWLYLYKAGSKAVDDLGEEASYEDMELVAQRACVIAWNKLRRRLKDSAEPRPRAQWLGVKRTAAEMEADENPCLVGICSYAQRGLHWTIGVNGKNISAPRLALTLAGEICPIGLVVRHKCGCPPCINPTHLQWGTVQENSRDKLRDGTAQRFGKRLTAAQCAVELAKPIGVARKWPKKLNSGRTATGQALKEARDILRALA